MRFSQTVPLTFNESLDLKCDLIFHLFQFKIHFNLKSDYDNDLFYDLCQKILIKRENSFKHNKRKCFSEYEFNNKEEESEIDAEQRIFKVFSNYFYLISMGLVLCLLGPAFYMIFKYELFSNLISRLFKFSPNNNELHLKTLELKLKRKRVHLNKKLLKISNYQSLILALNDMAQKDEIELLNLDDEIKLITAQSGLHLKTDGPFNKILFDNNI